MRGQKSRSGSGIRPGFEGGQTPLYRRLPKLKGIAGGMGAGLPDYNVVNLSQLDAKFGEGEEVSIEALEAKRVLNLSGRESRLPLKVRAALAWRWSGGRVVVAWHAVAGWCRGWPVLRRRTQPMQPGAGCAPPLHGPRARLPASPAVLPPLPCNRCWAPASCPRS